MVAFSTRTLEEAIEWEANKTKSIKIPRDRFIQKMILRLTVIGSTGTTVSAHEDAPMSLVKNIRLVANGKDVYQSAPMADLFYVDKYEYGTEPERFVQTGTSLPAGSDLGRAVVYLDCGSLDAKDDFDVSSLLPAHMFSSLELFVDWGDSASLGSGYTISSAKLTVTLREADLTADELREIGKMLRLFETFVEKTIDAEYRDYTFAIDLPVGNQLRRSVITAIRGGVRSDAQILAFKVTQESPVRAEIMQSGWYESQAQDKLEYGVETVIRGVTIIDYEGLGGLDARDLKSGDIKFRANSVAPSGVTKVRLLTQEIAV